MLKAHGDYILPDNVPSNEFLNLEGNKISTSKNYAVWLNEYLEELPNRQDELRLSLQPMHLTPKTTTLHGQTSRHVATTNWLLSMVIS